MRVSFIDSINAIACDQWNSVAGTDYPFTRHEFLHALETSNATRQKSGWQPQHIVVYDDDNDTAPVAVMPLYVKYHSYGEYVFDWSWADAYHRHGLDYYPKLVAAIPFTPATGPRLCVKAGCNSADITGAVVEAMRQRAQQLNASSIHILFPDNRACEQFQQQGLQRRRGAQYHWFNEGFNSFDDFMASFSSRKRKNLKKERLRITQQNLRLDIIEGEAISPDIWRQFYYFYQLTYAKRSGHGGYLNQQFFELIAASMAKHLVLVLAYAGDRAIAGALNFRDSDTLYGRYWGCTQEFDCLHFEACYYQGIEYCIANNLRRFDPGAQGEHKIQRGFTPVETCSNHWIAHPGFSAAIGEFLQRDNEAIQRYIQQARQLLPFKKGQSG